MKQRKKILISGIVQGVGFRPAVYRHAVKNNISGLVINTSSGVVIEAEGNSRDVENFIRAVENDAPPQARIDSLKIEDMAVSGGTSFVIGRSALRRTSASIVPSDLGMCAQCREDIFNSAGRRHFYPFTNCTNCGPRFTIVKNLPYDRPFTTMRDFTMCKACLAEYEDPADRRFHAQPNACLECGPQVEFHRENVTAHVFRKAPPTLPLPIEGGGRGGGEQLRENKISKGHEALKLCAQALNEGRIAAIQSLGGFHLACCASNKEAVIRLRKLKKRPHKPFAVMVSDMAQAEKLCLISDFEKSVLSSPRAPIIMLKKKDGCPQWPSDGLDTIGIMLAYTPLHAVLFRMLADSGFVSPLVMTSGNRADEPICRTREEAFERLSGIADVFLVHNREIHNRCDDSVVFAGKDKVYPVRRSRGYVPDSVRLAKSGPCVLGCGGLLKNTFCLTRSNEAFLSQYIGDLDEEKAQEFYLEALAGMKAFLEVSPEIIAHDLHPDYHSTRLALKMEGRKIGIQHHFAHVAGVMAEHNITGPVLGAALDGTGYGTDSTIWGCEFILAEGGNFNRLGHLKPFPLPGGDAAVYGIWRTALSCIKTFCPGYWDKYGMAGFNNIGSREAGVIERMIDGRINSPMTSSMGRLFDAAAFIAGIRKDVTYEAQAAMELESLCAGYPAQGYGFDIYEENGVLIADPGPVIKSMLLEKEAGKIRDISSKFHRSVADMACEMIFKLSKNTGIKQAVLSGGVFQNRIILEGTIAKLARSGFKVFTNEQTPANDGGISLGQAWIAMNSA